MNRRSSPLVWCSGPVSEPAKQLAASELAGQSVGTVVAPAGHVLRLLGGALGHLNETTLAIVVLGELQDAEPRPVYAGRNGSGFGGGCRGGLGQFRGRRGSRGARF